MKKYYWVVAGGILLLAYGAIWQWMVDRWLAPGSYYSHGFLIPLMSAYLVWKDRAQIALPVEEGQRLGLWIVIGALLFYLVCAFWKVYFAGAGTFLVVLGGAVLYLYGPKPFRWLWFPLFFLVFMIPIPLITVADLSLKLKLLAAATAIRIIDFFGVVAVRDGSYIHFSNGTMIVGDICSGLRSLIALLAFGAFFSYLSKLSRWGQILLFLASVPIAWIANICRIVILCFVGQTFGIEAATGFSHDASGILIFIFAFLMLFGVEKGLGLLRFGRVSGGNA